MTGLIQQMARMATRTINIRSGTLGSAQYARPLVTRIPISSPHQTLLQTSDEKSGKRVASLSGGKGIENPGCCLASAWSASVASAAL